MILSPLLTAIQPILQMKLAVIVEIKQECPLFSSLNQIQWQFNSKQIEVLLQEGQYLEFISQWAKIRKKGILFWLLHPLLGALSKKELFVFTIFSLITISVDPFLRIMWRYYTSFPFLVHFNFIDAFNIFVLKTMT